MTIYFASALWAARSDGPNQGDKRGGAHKSSRELTVHRGGQAGARGMRQPPRVPASMAGDDELPAGFSLLSEVKDLSLLGCWPRLEDGMSACMPTTLISNMQRRHSLGDQEAAAWLKLHARACSGDAEAQRTFGVACENGSHNTPVDVQRAFFWYFRAGLQGDLDSLRNAERLMHRGQGISSAAMAEPLLIHPGQWRITAHLSSELLSASLFDLSEDGTACGVLLGNSRATVTSSPAPTAEPSKFPDLRYRGGWAFDNIGQVLTIIFESEPEERRWRGSSWQIEIVGCKPDSLFGRDRRMVGYTLERLTTGMARDDE